MNLYDLELSGHWQTLTGVLQSAAATGVSFGCFNLPALHDKRLFGNQLPP
jgi:hypothetical protein